MVKFLKGETREERAARWVKVGAASALVRELEAETRRMLSASPWREWLAALQRVLSTGPEEWAPGDWTTSAMLVLKQDAPDAVREEAARNLARLVGVKFVPGNSEHTRARSTLPEMASQENRAPKAVLETIKMGAVVLALGDMSRPQRMRVHGEYAKEADGTVAVRPPEELNADEDSFIWRWFYAAVCRHTIDALLSETEGCLPADLIDTRGAANSNPLDLIVALDVQHEWVQLLDKAIPARAPAVRRTVALALSGLRADEIAAEQGISVGAVRQNMHRAIEYTAAQSGPEIGRKLAP